MIRNACKGVVCAGAVQSVGGKKKEAGCIQQNHQWKSKEPYFATIFDQLPEVVHYF